MKHLLFYTDMAGIFGAEQCTHALSLAMRRAGYRITIAQPRAAHHLISEREGEGIEHQWLEPDNIWDFQRPARALTDRSEPDALLTNIAPDLVFFSDGGPLSSLTAKEATLERGIPYVDLIHCVTPTWAAALAPHLPRLPPVFERAAQVIAVSRANLDQLHAHFGLPASRGLVIHNGRPDVFFAPRSEPARARLREEWSIPPGGVVCMSVGRFDPSKGYQYQLAALQHLRESPAWPHLFFVWVGGGLREDYLKQLVRRLRVDGRILLLVNRTDIPALLDAADMFVLPSQFEGMPLAIMEAMAKGLPVIATAVSGTPEALGDTGWLLADPSEDPALPKHLAAAIVELALDPSRRHAFGQAGRARAQVLFRETRMIDAYRQLIERALC